MQRGRIAGLLYQHGSSVEAVTEGHTLSILQSDFCFYITQFVKLFSVGNPMQILLPSASCNVSVVTLSGSIVFEFKHSSPHLSSSSSDFLLSYAEWENCLSSLNLSFFISPRGEYYLPETMYGKHSAQCLVYRKYL